MFSRGTSFKNCSREAALFASFIFLKILKNELSPARELNFGCFRNGLGRISGTTQIPKIAVLPASQLDFWCVRMYKMKKCFLHDFAKIPIFPMFFNGFGVQKGPRGTPGKFIIFKEYHKNKVATPKTAVAKLQLSLPSNFQKYWKMRSCLHESLIFAVFEID